MSQPPPYTALPQQQQQQQPQQQQQQRPPPPYQPGAQPAALPMGIQQPQQQPGGMFVIQQPGMGQAQQMQQQPMGQFQQQVPLQQPVNMQQPQQVQMVNGQPMFMLPQQTLDQGGVQQPMQGQPQQQPMYVVVQQPMNGSMSGSTTYLPANVPPPSPAWGALPHQSLGGSQTLAPMLIPQGLNGSMGTRPLVMVAADGKSGSPGASQSRSPGQSTSSRPQPDVKMWGFALADAYHPSLQRVPVPPSVVRPTRGIQGYNNDVASSSTMPCGSTVCLKYSGSNTTTGCPLNENCPNFHVDLTYMEKARHTSDALCCAIHNDYFSQEMMISNCAPHVTNSRFTLVLEDRAEIELLPSQLSFTIGLEHLSTRASTKVINLRKQVCRLHLEGKCKWTKDCGHVHLCREFHASLSKFHHPSLIFLLMTDTSSSDIETKLREGPPLLEFFASKSCIPLVQQLVENKKTAALQALVNVGAKFTQSHWDALSSKLGLEIPQSISERLLSPVCVSITRHVDAPVKNIIGGGAADGKDGVPGSSEDHPLTMPTFSPGASLTGHPQGQHAVGGASSLTGNPQQTASLTGHPQQTASLTGHPQPQ